MTPYDFYRVTLAEFVRHIAVERHALEKKGFDTDHANEFSTLLTEIYYLKMHMSHLRGMRYKNPLLLDIERDTLVQEKLMRKRRKLGRYKSWLKGLK